MSGYVGSMPNKVLIQTATLYHWIQNPLTELGLAFHEEKNLFQWVNLWNQGKFHLTFLTRSSRIWDCEAYTAEKKTNHRTETFALPTDKLYNCQSKAINACTSQSVKLM